VKDILFHFDSYPDPTPVAAIDQAVRFAATLGSGITALAVQVDFKPPGNWLAERLVNLSAMCAQEEQKSLANCKAALAAFSEKAATERRVTVSTLLAKSEPALLGDVVSFHARTRDVCLIPMVDSLDGQRSVAEAVLFQSGRPVVIFRPGAADLPAKTPGSVVLAWDGSRQAARAMADALPIMKLAREVRVLTVVKEKPEATAGLGNDVVRHLGSHGINAVADEVDIGPRKIGPAISDFVKAHAADLLVMGGYGHSKLREFILGGATQHLLQEPNVAIMLSH
jgi:nucleotide-binding universal stress UspA family protein